MRLGQWFPGRKLKKPEGNMAQEVNQNLEEMPINIEGKIKGYKY